MIVSLTTVMKWYAQACLIKEFNLCLKKWLKVALMVTAIATGTSIQVDAETVLYVPQDDRPVSLQYTVDTAKAAG